MARNAVPGFLPSVHGFRFANRWPKAPAWRWDLGLVQLGIGDVSRGLCGGMAYAVRDRYVRDEPIPPDADPPPYGSPLFREIVRRQVDSFGPLWTIPLRFWLSAIGGQERRNRETVRAAWPAIRADIDSGRLSMVGLVRDATANAFVRDLGHQVVGYCYEATAQRVEIGVYDPNHPGDDAITVAFQRATEGGLDLRQSTGEPLLGLLRLP